MPRLPERDPLQPRPRKKAANESKSEASTRVREELRALIADERYRKGDPEFRAHVRRQYERVFNDPDGKRGGLHVGVPNVYAAELEPYRSGSMQSGIGRGERRLSKRMLERKQGPVSGALAASPVRSLLAGGAKGLFKSGQTITPPGERYMGYYEDPGRRYAPAPGPQRSAAERDNDKIGWLVRDIENVFRGRGFELAADYLERYRHGHGGVVQWSWERLVSYDAAKKADAAVTAHYERWFTGGLKDTKVGQAFLNLVDGQSRTEGSLNPDSDGYKRLYWDGTWSFQDHTAGMERLPAPVQAHKKRQADFGFAVGDAAIIGWGEITFTRDGDRILVDGLVDFRFDEPYDYEAGLSGLLILGGTLFDDDLPTVSGSTLKRYADEGPAEVFRTQASILRRVQGVIVLTDGKPDPKRSSFHWQIVSEAG